mgnify:FL=1
MKKLIACLVSIALCLFLSMTSSCAQENWVGSWSTSPVEFSIQKFFGNHFKDFGLHHLTFRTVIKPTLTGETVRLTFSNTYGTGPMTIDAVTIAKTISKQCIKLPTKKTVTFNGCKKVTLEKGETVYSDPLDYYVDALEPVTVSMYMKNTDQLKTFGLIGGKTYISSGNQVNLPATTGVPMILNGSFGEYDVIPLLTGLDVNRSDAHSTVIIGDSTLANDIPTLFSTKLHLAGIHNVGVLQQAIKGNRLCADGAGRLGMAYGESMLKRFERDALNQPGVKTVIIKVGCNDIIHPNCKSMMGIAPKVTTEQMIDAYKTLISKAHERNIQVYLVTRSAWKGYTRNILNKGDDIEWTPEIDQMRKDINTWIKTNPADGYIDLDDLCQDEDRTQLRSEYVTDGVHFTLEGQKAVVDKLPVTV